MSNDNHTLIQSLQNPTLYEHEVSRFELVETHISWVLLTGKYAYKIKKPVDLGFLDFSSIDKRKFYCEEELRLNRRLAPDMYLAVIPVTGTSSEPQINGTGAAIEYAVKMLQFPQEAQLDRVLAKGALTQKNIDQLAHRIALFHQHITPTATDSPFGTPEHIHEPVMENFTQIADRLDDPADIKALLSLKHWADGEYTNKLLVLRERKQNGFIRECHGDLHLRNVALLEEEILIFDCIEFNPNLRWIDLMSEVAFMVMDLQDRNHPTLASRFLNHYLQHSGDYAGLNILTYYLVYRAMVRAKVDCIRASQSDVLEVEQNKILDEYRSYIKLAEFYTQRKQAVLMITHGLSGSGKTTVSELLLEHLPAIRIRSDVERKRLYGYETEGKTHADVNTGIYSKEATDKTYAHLATLAEGIIRSGFSVIADATFLKQAQREIFYALGKKLSAPYIIIDCQAPDLILRERISQRAQTEQDASEATTGILDRQLMSQDTLTSDESIHTLYIDTSLKLDNDKIMEELSILLKGRKKA